MPTFVKAVCINGHLIVLGGKGEKWEGGGEEGAEGEVGHKMTSVSVKHDNIAVCSNVLLTILKTKNNLRSLQCQSSGAV